MESIRGGAAHGAVLPQDLPALSPAERRELNSLQAERDAELFWDGLLRLASRLESRDKLEAAVSLYGMAVAKAPERLRAKAQARLDAVEGRGAVGARVEFHLSRLARDAFDYKMILPMMAGSSVYSLAKGAALGRFAAASRPLWWMRGAPGRLSAASLGYFSEVPAFALSSRFLHGLGGAAPAASWGQEFSSAAITLGLLKSGGALAQSGLSRALGPAVAPGLRFATGQAAMFAGLWSAHRIEEKVGLRQARGGETAATDILSSMLSLGLGSQLGKRLLGPGHARRSAELDFRIQDRAATLNRPRFFPEKPAPAGFAPSPMMMSGEDGHSGDRPAPPAGSLVQVSSSEIRVRRALRAVKNAGAGWGPIADLAEKMAVDIRQDRRWTGAGRARQLSNLADILTRFGPEQGNPELAWDAFTQLAEVQALKLTEWEYHNRIVRLARDGKLSFTAKPAAPIEKPGLPPKSGDTGHALVFRTLDFFAQRMPAWRQMAENFHRAYGDLAGRELWQDRLIDLMERSLEMAQLGAELTPPLALGWLKAFEQATRGERVWENFEALDPRLKIDSPLPAALPEEAPPPPAKASSSRGKITSSQVVAVSNLDSALRLFTLAGSPSGGSRDFQVRLILPNLDQATWKIRADAQGNLSLLEEGRGQWRSPNGKQAYLEVEKVAGFSARFRVRFGSKSLLLDLQSIQDRSGALARLELAPNQPQGENDITEHFSSQPPKLERVKVEHAEVISHSSLRGESGIQLRYQIYLSNGDLLELLGQTSNRSGQLEIKQAGLRRFGEPADSARALEVSTSRIRSGQFRILLGDPAGYRFDFEIQVPKGGKERWRPEWTRLEVLDSPPPNHLRWSEGAKSAILDSAKAEASIRGLAADALYGELQAVEEMGRLGRAHDAALWELKDLFEMTWEPGIKAEDFGGLDLVRLREKIGEAFRDSARQNPMAKKVLAELEAQFGVASLIEAAPALPSLPPPPSPMPVPVQGPAAEKLAPAVPAAPIKPMAPAPVAKPESKAKPVPSPQEAVDAKIQIFLRPQAKKSYQLSLTKDISKLIARLSSAEAQELAEKYLALMPEAIQSKDWSRILPLLHVTESLVPSVHPEVRSEFVLRIGDLADQLMRLPGAFQQMLAFNYSRTIHSQAARDGIFEKRPGDSDLLADLRKNLEQLRGIPHWDSIRGGPGLARIYSQSRELKAEEAASFRVELWSALQIYYLDVVTRLKSNPDPEGARRMLTTISVLFRSLLGASSHLGPEAREVFFDKVGLWRREKLYRFQPFPGRFREILELEAEVPLLTSPALDSSQKQPKKN